EQAHNSLGLCSLSPEYSIKGVRLFKQVPLLLAVFVLLSCKERGRIPADTLVVALSAGPATLDPRYATDAAGMRMVSLLFNSLVRLGPDLEPVAEGAERWVVEKNAYVFFLRRDLRFHNGRPLKREDVEFSFATALKPGGPFATMRDIVNSVAVSEKN